MLLNGSFSHLMVPCDSKRLHHTVLLPRRPSCLCSFSDCLGQSLHRSPLMRATMFVMVSWIFIGRLFVGFCFLVCLFKIGCFVVIAFWIFILHLSAIVFRMYSLFPLLLQRPHLPLSTLCQPVIGCMSVEMARVYKHRLRFWV